MPEEYLGFSGRIDVRHVASHVVSLFKWQLAPESSILAKTPEIDPVLNVPSVCIKLADLVVYLAGHESHA